MNSRPFEGLRRFAPIVASAALVLLASPLHARDRRREIEVHTVEGLYAAIKASANCGGTANCNVRIHLAPGTYVLSERSPRGVPHGHKGSLRLPPGVSLVGSEEHVDTNGDGVLDPIDPADPEVFAVPGTETTIDGSQLILEGEERMDCAGQSRDIFPDPVIYIGVNNSISALSLVPGDHVAIGAPTNEPMDSTGSLSIEITDTVIQGGLIAVDFSNSECAAHRARSVLHFAHNVVGHAGAFGVGTTNFYTGGANDDPSDGPEVRATVAFNLFYENNTALRAAAGDEGTDGGSVRLHMIGNVFRGNGTNLQARGGVGRGAELRTVGNRNSVRSDFDTFGEAPQSLLLTGGSGEAVDNSLEVELFDTRFIRDSPDAPPELTIAGESGSDNHVVVRMGRTTVRTSDGTPIMGSISIQDETGPSEDTTARLGGSRQGFIRKNPDFPAPPEHFFLEP